MTVEDRRALDKLELTLGTLLPEEYQDCYEDLQPVPMRAAGLKFSDDGRVAWNEIWGSFCDLAMAGGPPHKGMLLEPAPPIEIRAHRDRYAEVVAEICRGVTMTTELHAQLSPVHGWIRVTCLSEGMAGWLVRAIVMENVAARCEGVKLDLPASPHFRLEKEIKNVVTVIAKTCHYWLGHMPAAQRLAISTLFTTLAEESPLIGPHSDEPAEADGQASLAVEIAEAIRRQIGLTTSPPRYAGWLGVECPDARAAIWMMRGLVVANVLSRREGTVLFVPVNSASDPGGARVVGALARIHRLAKAKEIL